MEASTAIVCRKEVQIRRKPLIGRTEQPSRVPRPGNVVAGKGSVVIKYKSLEDSDRIVEALGRGSKRAAGEESGDLTAPDFLVPGFFVASIEAVSSLAGLSTCS